jgi:hypothetical protein
VKRWTKNLFCFFSLLVFVGSVTLWVRSYFSPEAIQWNNRPSATGMQPWVVRYSGYGVLSAQGAAAFCRYETASLKATTPQPRWQYVSIPPTQNLFTPKSPDDRLNIAFGGFQLLYNVGQSPRY